MVSKIHIIITISLLLIITACYSTDYEEWRGFSIRNASSDTVTFIHIATHDKSLLFDEYCANYTLPPKTEKTDMYICVLDPYYELKLKYGCTYDTVKLYRHGKLEKIWSEPLTNNISGRHTPYSKSCWEKIVKPDTIILRFTITDKDFEKTQNGN